MYVYIKIIGEKMGMKVKNEGLEVINNEDKFIQVTRVKKDGSEQVYIINKACIETINSDITEVEI